MKEEITVSCTIHNNPNNISLIDYLCKRFTYQDRSTWMREIKNGRVVINAKRSVPEQNLQLKDCISYTTLREEPPVNTNIQIIYEDEYILVVDKPAPLPVHAQGVFILNTLIHILRKQTCNEDLCLGHRLDRETSGVVVLGKSRNITSKLMTNFEEAHVKKQYLAITRGVVDFDTKLVQGWMGKKPGSLVDMRRELIKHQKDNYKESFTHFTCKEKLAKHSVLVCEPLSGRTNQIRVHLDAIGHSIVGDKLYGHRDEEYIAYLNHLEKRGDIGHGGNWDHPRHLLHAHQLEMKHPITNKPMKWEAPIPLDMQSFIHKNKMHN
ncbi:MAG: RluA family pseudouridine synthase [Bdellovibrionales bacterium]|nr:RluA family pseudouridine synthase [Bdellovibrionales bacterium]